MVTARTKSSKALPTVAPSTTSPRPTRAKSTAAGPQAKPSAKASQTAPLPLAATAAKPIKPKKAKPVRDSFTMPKGEYAVLSHLKQRGLTLAHPAKKSELIRAGVSVLAALSDADFLAALKALPAIKTGRPSKTDSA